MTHVRTGIYEGKCSAKLVTTVFFLGGGGGGGGGGNLSTSKTREDNK